MSEYSQSHQPYSSLGSHLKYLREQSRESLAEVSGAVEIDEETLQRIELGSERPSEDILMLLVNHFGMQDQEAVQLWEMAGYDMQAPDKFGFLEEARANGKPVVMLVATDLRTLYSDGLDVVMNRAGMTLEFNQMHSQNQRVPVARVGISYEQAEQILATLQSALMKAKYQGAPKLLQAPDETKTRKKPKN
jgi:transcriptional regulator with XRE-family HTH domain